MTIFKKGDLVNYYNMWTKRRSKMRIKKVFKKEKGFDARVQIEHPDGRSFGKESVDPQDLDLISRGKPIKVKRSKTGTRKHRRRRSKK